MELAAGIQKEQSLRAAGFNSDDIEKWKGETRQKLSDSGFSGKEVGEYFGEKNPDMAPTREFFKQNLDSFHAERSKQAAEGKQVPAHTFAEALEAGFQSSTLGLVARQKGADIAVPEDAPTFLKIASGIGSFAGDVPAMASGGIAGFFGGAVVGGAVGTATLPVVGTVGGAVGGGAMGAAAGANALPAAIRKILMDHYEKGDIHDFKDFWERASSTFIETSKAAITGAATSLVGGAVGQKLLATGFAPAARAVTQTASEIATMVTVGKSLDGQVPHAEDFLEAAAVIGLTHGVTHVASRLRDTYAKTGIRPEEVVQQALENPTVKQDLLSTNVDVPKAFEGAAEKPLSDGKAVINLEGSPLTKKSEVFGDFGGDAQKITVKSPEEPTVAIPKSDFSEAEKKVLGQIGDKEPKAKDPISWNKIYSDVVDKLDPIRLAVNALAEDPKALSTMEDPYKLARMANDSKAKARYMFEKGVIDYSTLEKTGKSLNEIMEPVGDDVQKFNAYLVSARALELNERGINSGVDIEAAKQVVSDGKERFEKTSKGLVDYQNGVLKYLKDSGYLTDKGYQQMLEANKAYVPFSRLDEENVAKGGKSKASPIKAIKGSDAKIANPIESIVENTVFFTKLAEQNRALRALVDLSEKDTEQTLIEKVKGTSQAIDLKPEEIAKLLKQHGVEADPQAFSIFRGVGKALGDNEFAVFRDGKREVFSTEPALASAIKAIDGDVATTGLIFKLAKAAASSIRMSLSVTPDFIMRNFFRDQITAGSFSKYGSIPFVDAIKAMGSLLKKDDSYYEWLKSGGASGSFMDLDKNYIENNIYKLSKETGLIDKTWNVVKTPLDFIRVAGELAEQSTRLAEFKKTVGDSKDAAKIMEGGFAAREVTVDFQRMGAKIKALNAITAFQNVAIQGLDRTVRAFKDDPQGLSIKAIASITVPSVLLWYANKDDPRYREIPRWEKDLFWIVMTDDHIYRIPKPQELGVIFGTLPERVLEKFFTDNPKAMSDFTGTLSALLTPSAIPNIASPVIEQYFNRSLFTGHNIVPAQFEKILPAYHYNEYTTETGKALGKMIGAIPGVGDIGKDNVTLKSPMVLENYIRAWSGNLGMYALKVADAGLTKAGVFPDPVKPTSTLADIPFIKAFVVRYPAATAQSIQDFHDRFKKSETVIQTIHHLASIGDAENMQKEFTLQENQDKLVNLGGIRDGLNHQTKLISLIYRNPQIAPDEKRQLIDGLYYGMIQEAKMGNELFTEIEKAVTKK